MSGPGLREAEEDQAGAAGWLPDVNEVSRQITEDGMSEAVPGITTAFRPAVPHSSSLSNLRIMLLVPKTKPKPYRKGGF